MCRNLEGDNRPSSFVLYYMAYGLVPLSPRLDRSIVELLRLLLKQMPERQCWEEKCSACSVLINFLWKRRGRRQRGHDGDILGRSINSGRTTSRENVPESHMM